VNGRAAGDDGTFTVQTEGGDERQRDVEAGIDHDSTEQSKLIVLAPGYFLHTSE